MKFLKQILCVLLCLCLFSSSSKIYAAPDIILTGVNDTFLPLSSSTMPIQKSGVLYVPYTVFKGTLDINGSYNEKQQSLVLYNWDYTLNFALGQGYVYDQDNKSYSPPAFTLNGVVYVPVQLVCSVFGLSYSLISSAYPVLRITNNSVSMSDHAFVTTNADYIDKLVSNYLNPTPVPTTPSVTTPVEPETNSSSTTTTTTTQPEVVEPTKKPEKVYLSFYGEINEDTSDILQTLEESNYNASFFVNSNSQDIDGDILRKIIANKHTLGISVYADSSISEPSALLENINTINDYLFINCGIKSRILLIENGVSALSQSQIELLESSGYILFDSSISANEQSNTASTTLQNITSIFEQSNNATSVQFGINTSTNNVLDLLVGYMKDNDIPCDTISFNSHL